MAIKQQNTGTGKIDKRLPQLGSDRSRWEDEINKWTSTKQIGIDCSMFVFQALKEVHEQEGGVGAKDAWIKKFKSRSSNKVSPPGSINLISSRRGAKKIKSGPASLKAGDLMYLQKNSNGIAHIRIVMRIKHLPDGSIHMETAESASAAKGPAHVTWRFTNPAKFSSLRKVLPATAGKAAKLVRPKSRSRNATYYRHAIP